MDYLNFEIYKEQILRNDKEIKELYEKEKLNYEVSLQLKTIREKKRISQFELAKRIGTSQSVIARIESGKSNISMKTLGRVLNGLGAKLTIK